MLILYILTCQYIYIHIYIYVVSFYGHESGHLVPNIGLFEISKTSNIGLIGYIWRRRNGEMGSRWKEKFLVLKKTIRMRTFNRFNLKRW